MSFRLIELQGFLNKTISIYITVSEKRNVVITLDINLTKCYRNFSKVKNIRTWFRLD